MYLYSRYSKTNCDSESFGRIEEGVLGEYYTVLILGTHQIPIRMKPIVIEILSMDVNLSGPFLQN